MFAINSSPVGALSNSGRWKRRASDDEEERRDVKKTKYSWYFTLESESPTPTDEDDESIYSVQAYETEFAHDTSDTSTTSRISSNESDVSVHLEYELNSGSENDNLFTGSSSCSEPESIVEVEFIAFCDSEGLGLADDSDDSRSSIDSEIKKADFWACVQCRSPNNNPLFPYCDKCYQVRKVHFPRSRPRRKPRSQKSDSKKSSTTVSVISSQELIEMDSGIASSQYDLDSETISAQELEKPISQNSEILTCGADSSERSTEISDLQNNKISMIKVESQQNNMNSKTIASTISVTRRLTNAVSQTLERDEVDSSLVIKECDSDDHLYSSENSSIRLTNTKNDESQTNSNSTDATSPTLLSILAEKLHSRGDKSQLQSQGPEGPCLICTVSPKDSAFVHGNSMHMCCCYRCAKKVWLTNGYRCPICKRKVSQVSKAFYA